MKPAVERTRPALWLGLLCGILLGTAGCSQSFGDRLNQVRELHAQGRYEASLEMLRALMDEDPTDPEVNYRFGKSLMEAGKPSLAIWPLQRAVESPAYAVEASMLLAEANLYSRTPEDAIAAVDVALAIEPNNVEALALRAHARLKAGHGADALADVERAVALEPDNPALWIPRVLALLEFDRFDEAQAVLDAGRHAAEVGEVPESEQTLARLCLANAGFAVDAGDEWSAEVIYADCLDAYPTDSRVVLDSAGFYDRIGEPERATALLRSTFENTRATEFGRALLRRMRQLSGRAAQAHCGAHPGEPDGIHCGSMDWIPSKSRARSAFAGLGPSRPGRLLPEAGFAREAAYRRQRSAAGPDRGLWLGEGHFERLSSRWPTSGYHEAICTASRHANRATHRDAAIAGVRPLAELRPSSPRANGAARLIREA